MTNGVDELGRRREQRRLRAVVAADDEGMRRLLAAVLELDGWDVRCASDGDEAVSVSESHRPDAVFLDVKMPRSDGISALRRLRQTEAGRDLAIVMVSDAAHRQRGQSTGGVSTGGVIDTSRSGGSQP